MRQVVALNEKNLCNFQEVGRGGWPRRGETWDIHGFPREGWDMTGYTSTFLVKQQEHAAGKEAFFNLLHGDLHRGTEWTDQDGKAGDLASSPWQVFPPGDYTALLQL